MSEDVKGDRRAMIHLIRSGNSPTEIAEELGRSVAWVYKWQKRFRQEGWAGLAERSRRPHHSPRRFPSEVNQAICQARSELEMEARAPEKLSYIGARAIRARLRRGPCRPLPSVASIERAIHRAGLTHPRAPAPDPRHYPHLCPQEAHVLTQADIYPRYLPGGALVSCFNGLDVVSRYACGKQSLHKRSSDAVDFMLYMWRVLGISLYMQIDNEGCFSGGFTHPYVLGKVVRAALYVGTEIVFSPVRHPQSNGSVERFHQDYGREVWEKHPLTDLPAVQQHSTPFFRNYCQSEHHTALRGQSPDSIHQAHAYRRLPDDFQLPTALPLTEGRVHFMRLVDDSRQVDILNVLWDVPRAQPQQGVWATLELRCPQSATLRIYDAAPDAPHRHCLASHPFPLSETVQPLLPQFRTSQQPPSWWHSLLADVRNFFYDVLKVDSVVKVP